MGVLNLSVVKRSFGDCADEGFCLDGAVGYERREGNGSPLACSCLENPMDIGAWRTAVHGVAKSPT